jgi:hypothetical protein
MAPMRAAVLLALLLLAAPRARADATAEVRFRILDLDGDGSVTLAEAAGIDDVVAKFDRADADRDGRLSLREFLRLEKMKVRVAATRRHHIRSAVARDARAAQREAIVETQSASAAAGGSARHASP